MMPVRKGFAASSPARSSRFAKTSQNWPSRCTILSIVLVISVMLLLHTEVSLFSSHLFQSQQVQEDVDKDQHTNNHDITINSKVSEPVNLPLDTKLASNHGERIGQGTSDVWSGFAPTLPAKEAAVHVETQGEEEDVHLNSDKSDEEISRQEVEGGAGGHENMERLQPHLLPQGEDVEEGTGGIVEGGTGDNVGAGSEREADGREGSAELKLVDEQDGGAHSEAGEAVVVSMNESEDGGYKNDEAEDSRKDGDDNEEISGGDLEAGDPKEELTTAESEGQGTKEEPDGLGTKEFEGRETNKGSYRHDSKVEMDGRHTDEDAGVGDSAEESNEGNGKGNSGAQEESNSEEGKEDSDEGYTKKEADGGSTEVEGDGTDGKEESEGNDIKDEKDGGNPKVDIDGGDAKENPEVVSNEGDSKEEVSDEDLKKDLEGGTQEGADEEADDKDLSAGMGGGDGRELVGEEKAAESAAREGHLNANEVAANHEKAELEAGKESEQEEEEGERSKEDGDERDPKENGEEETSGEKGVGAGGDSLQSEDAEAKEEEGEEGERNADASREDEGLPTKTEGVVKEQQREEYGQEESGHLTTKGGDEGNQEKEKEEAEREESDEGEKEEGRKDNTDDGTGEAAADGGKNDGLDGQKETKQDGEDVEDEGGEKSDKAESADGEASTKTTQPADSQDAADDKDDDDDDNDNDGVGGGEEEGSEPAVPLPHLQCRGRHVYMYALPPSLNLDYVANCKHIHRSVNMCKAFNNSGMGRPARDKRTRNPPAVLALLPRGRWFETDQFSLEITFHARMLEYPCLTADPAKATVFYVPFFAGLAIFRSLYEKDLEERDRGARETVEWLERQEWWGRHQGRDHLFVVTRVLIDFTRGLVLNHWGNTFLRMSHMLNATVLSIESQKAVQNSASIPYPSSFHPRTDRDVRVWQKYVLSFPRRKYRVAFGGVGHGMGAKLRFQLMDLCLKAKPHCHLFHCAKRVCMRPHNVIWHYMSAHFCFQPPGDTPTRKGMFDCMLAGGIPVLFHENTAFRYFWHLPKEHDSYSVFHSKEEFNRDNGTAIMEKLNSMPEAEVLRLREKVVELIPNIVYAMPGERLRQFRDAFHIAVESVVQKVSKMQLPDHPRLIKAEWTKDE